GRAGMYGLKPVLVPGRGSFRIVGVLSIIPPRAYWCGRSVPDRRGQRSSTSSLAGWSRCIGRLTRSVDAVRGVGGATGNVTRLATAANWTTSPVSVVNCAVTMYSESATGKVMGTTEALTLAAAGTGPTMGTGGSTSTSCGNTVVPNPSASAVQLS